MADNFDIKCKDIEMVKQRCAIGSSPDHSRQEMVEIYDKWAANYEHDLNIPGTYASPLIGADAVAELPGVNKNARILDVATGTGLAGFHLYEKGFRNIDGLDPSTAMLEEARKKGVFKNLICDFMGTNTLNINNGYYDIVVTTGGFAANSHLTHDCFPEVIRITKSGGYFVIVMPEDCLEKMVAYRGILEPAMKNLEKEGKWRMIKREVFPNVYRDRAAVLFTFEIL